jgi:hypothetical protein
MIKFEEISVIVQGPVISKSNDNESIRYTYLCLKSIRKFLPGSTIILSTWKNSDLKGLDYDVLVENDDPGNIQMILRGSKFSYNLNRQLVSTINGLKKSKTKYSLKLRSDLILYGNKFMRYLFKYKNRNPNYSFLENKVIFTDISSFNPQKNEKRLFNPSDWFTFGFTTDLLKIWNVPLLSIKNEYLIVEGCIDQENFLSAEQYIWTSFVKKYLNINFESIYSYSEELLKLSNMIFANNLIFLNTNLIPINSPKYDNESFFIIKMKLDYYYSFNDWKKLYNQYCNGKFIYIPNIIFTLYKKIKLLILRFKLLIRNLKIFFK